MRYPIAELFDYGIQQHAAAARMVHIHIRCCGFAVVSLYYLVALLHILLRVIFVPMRSASRIKGIKFSVHCLVCLALLYSDIAHAQNDSSFQNKTCIPPAITEFKIFNENLPVDSVLRLKTIELSTNKNSFSISFSSSDTTNNIQYMLLGADKSWMNSGRSATINYTLLPPGRYDFKFRCRQHETTGLVIIIGVPFYLSTWFIILGCAAIVGIAYYLHTMSVRKLMAVEAIRQRVSRDLHDDIGSTLSTINILSTMAKSRMMEDPVKASEYISKISDNSSRLMEAMDDIVWSINPLNDTMQKIFARMCGFATEVLEAKEIQPHFHFDERAYDIALNMEQRRDLFLIFKEAVNNTAKYANATEVKMEVMVKDQKLLLVIQDNGRGFDVENADSGNGLNNMQKRADKLNASFRITSTQNSGTTVSLEMQIT